MPTQLEPAALEIARAKYLAAKAEYAKTLRHMRTKTSVREAALAVFLAAEKEWMLANGDPV